MSERTQLTEDLGSDRAFPRPPVMNEFGNLRHGQQGLTKRELFAAMAMQGMVSEKYEIDEIAQDAVAVADALLKQLAK